MQQKISPFLWFDHQAEEAANFYVSVFKNSKVGKILRQDGKVLTMAFELNGQEFTALNGGPHFIFNPSVSFFAICESEAETDTLWQQLAESGDVLMPLEKQHWSEKYGWLQDRYGLSWQISLGKIADVGQKITPSLLFVGEQHGRAEEAVHFYTSLFENAYISGILKYEAGEPQPAGTVKNAQFYLNGEAFMVMDSAITTHEFQFNEAVSFVINCEGQEEVDYFWKKMTADGGEDSQCGWLKDKFGVSWQIVPTELPELLSDPDPARAQRAMGAMMNMQKIDIEKLRLAAADDSKMVITVETTVDASLEKIWQLWTQPIHIVHWNNASDDWHTPHAENDLRKGGAFNYRMAARDGSFAFDFGGVYDEVLEHAHIEYTLGDARKVQINFFEVEDGIHVVETFEAENINSIELQRGGWQAILDNFRKYAENGSH